MLLLGIHVNSLPNYLGFLTGMSKFFKWLKKDKQQEASLDDENTPIQAENLASEPKSELKENNSSATEKPIINTPSEIADESKISFNNEVPESLIESNVKANPDTIENIHSPIDPIRNESPQQASINESEVVETTLDEPIPESNKTDNDEDTATQEASTTEKSGFFSKLKRGLSRTKESIGSGIVGLFRGKAIDDDLFEELETQLLVADMGMDTTVKIVKQLTESSNRKQLKDGDALYQLLKEQMAEMLQKVESPLALQTESGPFVILMVGVNGVGKTTTIGKMAKQFQQQGKKVMLAAGDTFRAAAVEQLQVWGERNDIPVVAQQTGSDSASVIFDAFQSAKAKNIDVLIADTAGRLQNKDHLMEELKKVVRVMKKITPDAPHEIMLTIDAGTGQNAVSQAKLFNDAVGLTGISLTKLDGTAKGGVIFAIADQFNIPIRYVGIGEGIDDLRPFNSQDFVNALFSEPDSQQ